MVLILVHKYDLGDWVLDRRFGYGIWVDAEGFSHEGEWRDDQMWRKDEK